MNTTAQYADHYAYRVQWSEEDGEYVGTVVEFPGLSWLSPTPGETLDGIRRVTGECVEDMLAHGEQPPQPLSDRSYSGRFNVRITPDAHRRLALEAQEEGVSLNHLVAERLAV